MTHFFIISLLLCVTYLPVTGQEQPSEKDVLSQVEKLIYRGAYEEAEKVINQALKQDSLNLPMLLYKYQTLRYRHKVNASYRIARDNFKTFRDQANGIHKIKLFLNRAESYIISGKEEKCIKILNETKSLINSHSGQIPELNLYADYIQGIYFSRTKGIHDPKVEKAYLSCYRQLNLLEQPPPYYLSQLLHKIAIIHLTQGDYEKALDYFQKELEVCTQYFPPDHFDLGIARYSIGNVYYERMEYQNALDHYLPAYEIWKKHYEPSDKYMRHLTEAIGDMYRELGQKNNALYFYNLSVMDKTVESHPQLQKLSIADSLFQNDQSGQAYDLLGEALSFRKKIYGDKHALTGACQNQLARAYLSKGRYNEALNSYQLAMTMLVKDFSNTSIRSNPEVDMEILSDKFLLESLAGKALAIKKLYDKNKSREDLDLAFNTAEKAVHILEEIRRSPLSENSKAFWTKKYFSLFDLSIELAYEKYGNSTDFIKTAFPLFEKSKALLLQNALRFNKISSFLHLPDSVILKENELKKSIQEYLVRIEQEEQQCENAQLNKLELWNEELLGLKLAYNAFVSELRNNYPDYYHLKYDHQVHEIDEIKAKVLPDDQSVLIEFFEGEKYIYGIAFSKTSSFCYRLQKDSAFQEVLTNFTELTPDLNQSLSHPDQSFRMFTDQAYYLYNKLMQPVLDHFPDSVDQLIIIPEQHMFHLPFACLLTSKVDTMADYRHLPYLMKEYKISYSQSSEVLAWANTPSKATTYRYDYLGFAPKQFYDDDNWLTSLNWNENEVRTTNTTWNGKAFINADATRENFIKHANLAKIQHFATHALIDDHDPMLSRIVFQGDSNNLLYTYELYSIPIRSELIVLNACNTSRGKWENGEGMISLERAFQYSGCPSLLTSTWPVDDESSSLLTIRFFDYLRAGDSKSEALKKARQDFLAEADPAQGHPYYWAGFRIIGNTDTIRSTKHFRYGYLAWCLFFATSIILLVVYYKRQS